MHMKKKFYIRPKTEILEVEQEYTLMNNGSATREGYGTADESDETIQIWG